MSFSRQFKEEILNKELDSKEEKFAFLSAVIRQIGSIHISKNSFNIEIECESNLLILRIANELKLLYNTEVDIKVVPENKFKKKTFYLELPSNITKQLATDTGIISYSGDIAIGFANAKSNKNWTEAQIRAFLFGIAVTSANVSVPTPSATDSSVYEGGYSLEMRFSSETTAYDVMEYFAMFDILMKKVERNESYILYIRESEMISDFMAFFGASNSVIELNDIIVARSVRNMTNRVQNCEIANIDKTVNAGQKQFLAIKLIEEKIGLNSLSEKLREIAQIRLENPDFSLDQIANSVGDGISKSGINHRFRKIMEIAESLKNQ